MSTMRQENLLRGVWVSPYLVKSFYSGNLRADDFDNAVGGAPVRHQNSMWSR